MDTVEPAGQQHKAASDHRFSGSPKVYKGKAPGFISFEEAVCWIRERDLRVVVKAAGSAFNFSDPLKIDTTPPVPLTSEAAAISLMKVCRSGDMQIITLPDAKEHYFHLTKKEMADLSYAALERVRFFADNLFEEFPIATNSVQQFRNDDEWLPTEEAINEVMRSRREARSRERAALWLLEMGTRGQAIVRGGGIALAYRAAGFVDIWRSMAFLSGPLWSLSSLEKLTGRNERKSGGKLGRKEKDFWRAVQFEAGAWLGLYGGEHESGTQSRLADFLQMRAQAYGDSLGHSQAQRRAREMLLHFRSMKADGALGE